MGIPLAELTIDAVMVRELLFQQHSDLAELSLLAVSSGWDNAIFRLGEHLAVRLPRRELAAALVLNEQRWLPRLAAQLPLKVPVPLRVGVPQEWYPWAWSIVPWIDGETADVAPPDDDQADVLGRFFEALHRPAPADAPHNPYRGVPLAQREVSFEERAAKLTGRCDAIDTRVIAIWNEALAAQESTASTWIHGDMHPRNVLCARGRIEGIIDWGDIAQGDAASDLAGIWMLLPNLQARRRAMAACPTVSSATWARAKGWAVLYAAIFLDAALESDPGMVAMAKRTLERLKQGP
jgi:aminoglycoside phosphotransferase (APT) family kinase protein